MFKPFICGSFHEQEEEDNLWVPSSTPKRTSRKTSSFCKRYNRNNKNPYSNRGLDKFSTVLADLEERRQKIYEQKGSQDISFVRFVYSNSNEWRPIVVKLRTDKQDQTKVAKTQNSEALEKSSLVEVSMKKEVEQVRPVLDGNGKEKKKSFSWNMNLDMWRRSYYFPMAIVLILLCLLVAGRSAAILCTSIWWYLVPTLKGDGSILKRSMKKKEYVRKLTEKKMGNEGVSSYPKSKIMGTMKESSPRHHKNGKI